MKKFLLALFCLVGFMAAYAVEATVTFSDLGFTNGQEVSTVKVDDNVSLGFLKGTNSNTPKYYSSGTAMRIYGGNNLEVVGSTATTINSVTFTTVSSNPVHADSEVSAGTMTIESTKTTITNVNASKLVFTQGGTSGHVRIVSVTVNYTLGEATQVNAPVITPNGGEVTADSEISISCATDGASIYYTIDGTEPSATNGTLYSAPFKLSAAATVKAIAVKSGLDNSSVTETSFTFPVANIGEFISAANPHATTIAGPVTVVAQSGSYLFLQDETGRIVAFGSLENTYNNGDQLTNIKGTYTVYNGLTEMNVVASSFGQATAGQAVEPEELTLEELGIDNLLAYVKVTGVTIPEGSGKSFTITDATGTEVPMYNTLNITVPTGENLTVVGFISCYKTTMQLMPLEITSSTGLEVVEAPVIFPNGGAIAKNQEITISCPTEGVSIYYTTDGTEPTTSSTLYNGAFTLAEECTVKAIATKEGMSESLVVEATFTFLSENTKVATFNFTDPASLTPAQVAPEAGSGVVVDDIEFTKDVITLVCEKDTAASTSCRLYLSTSAGALVDLRTYKPSTITISANNANIVGIEFTGNKADNTYLSVDKGTFEGKNWSSTAATSSVVFTTTATTNIQTITVTYEVDADGVEGVEINNEAPATFYNLQGVKVDNPANGIYIKVQGSKASKVYIK